MRWITQEIDRREIFSVSPFVTQQTFPSLPGYMFLMRAIGHSSLFTWLFFRRTKSPSLTFNLLAISCRFTELRYTRASSAAKRYSCFYFCRGGGTTLHDCAVTEECEEVWNPVSINMRQSSSLMRHPRGKHRVDWQPSDSLPHLGFPAWKCLTISKATWFIPQR